MSARRDRSKAPSRQVPPGPAPAPEAWPRTAFAVVVLMAVAYAIGFQAICFEKYRNYLYRDFDLAIFVQAIHGVLRGEWFSSIRGMAWLGDHSSLILVPLAPLFAIAPHALTLLFFQTVALAAGAIPVWLLARHEGLPRPLPIACAALWLLQPALGYLNLFEFHPESLAVPFLLGCVLEVRMGRAGRAAIAAGIALLAREDVALVVLGFALLALLEKPRRPRLAGLLASLAIVSLVVSFGVLKPLLLSGQAEYGQMYARWGSGPGGIVAGVLTHPLDAIAAFWTTPGNPGDALAKKQLWLHLFGPVAGTALLAPLALLPALPVFAEHLLSERVHQHTIVFQYAALTLPIVMVASVRGIGRAHHALARRSRPGVAASALALLVLAFAVGSQVLFGPVVGRRVWQAAQPPEDITPDFYQRTLRPYRDRMLARVPKTGAVVAGFEFLPHLATRDSLHSLHHVLSGQYTYSDRPYPMPQGVRAIVGDLSSTIPYFEFDTGARLRTIAAERGLRPADAAAGTILMLGPPADSVEWFRVGATWNAESLDLVLDEQLLFLNAVRLDSVVTPGGRLRIESFWKRIGAPNRTYVIQVWLERGGKIAFYGYAHPLGYGVQPPQDWPAGTLVSETYHLVVPEGFPPGTYRPLFRPVSEDRDGNQEIPTVRIGADRMPMNFIALQPIEVVAGPPPGR